MTGREELIRKAYEAQVFSYSPYSHFQVGAALMGRDGTVYLGCNIENAAYSPTNCAERTAFFKAISEGQKEFAAIAIVGSHEDGTKGVSCTPCGVCLQVMQEFCNPKEFIVIVTDGLGHVKEFLLEDLLPQGFGADQIAW